MTGWRRRVRSENGAVLVAGLLLSLAVLMLIGAAVDIGNAFIARRHLVALADQAALSGSQALDLNALHQGTLALDPQQAQSQALQALAGSSGIQATATATPQAVAVELRETIPTVLLRLVGLSELQLSARAAAAPRTP